MYERKTWKNRETEFPGRRRMTAVDGQEDVYDISREEGLVLEEGDAFDADTMNNMEQRVGEGFDNTCQYLYKSTFPLDAWTGEGPYTQTVPLTPVDGGPAVTADSTSVMAGIDISLPEETRAELRTAASIINEATRTLGAGTISVSAEEKPDVDAEVYFMCKKGEV